MKINARQRVVLWGGFILLLLTLLVPHWKFGTIGDGGYHFFFRVPYSGYSHGKIDFVRLAMQFALVSLLTAGLTFLLQDKDT
jgi:hypothetical protein